jgi:hypothetical protein
METEFEQLGFREYPTRANPGQGVRAAAKSRRRFRRGLARAAVAKSPKNGAKKVTAAKRQELKRLGLTEAQFNQLETDRAVKSKDLVAADKLHAKLTKPIRSEKVARGIAARQALITLPEVNKDEEDVDYEIYIDEATKLIFKRKAPEGDDPIKLSKKPPEDIIWKITKSFKRARRGTDAWDAAERIYHTIIEFEGRDAKAVKVEGETKTFELYICGPFTLRFGQEPWTKKRGKFADRFRRRGKQGDPSSQEAATIIRQTARGELRILVQNRLRKEKTQLIDGAMFEGAYASLYRYIKKEITPGDEDQDDPPATAMPKWLADALPDRVQA